MRVLFLLTGGTIMMTAPASGVGHALTPDSALAARDLREEVPSLSRVAEIETRFVCNMDSADMQPADWVVLARVVHDALSEGTYAGVVVVHGTDTMAYSASALAVMLGALPAPVVFTGAQRPLAEARTDARQNLIDAASSATLPVPEVTIAFNSRLLRGVRTVKRDARALDAFDSPSAAPLATFGVGVDVAPHVRARGDLAPLDARLDPRVLCVRVFPGLDPKLVSGALHAGVSGLVLEAYGSGSLPHLSGSLIDAIAEARDRNVPVLVVSQSLRGGVDLSSYEGGRRAETAGAISGGDMTVEAALAKMMIGLGRFGPGTELSAFLARDVAGERSV
jgi:L-asparaginase